MGDEEVRGGPSSHEDVLSWVNSWSVRSTEAEDGTCQHEITVTSPPWASGVPDLDDDNIKVTYGVPMAWGMWLGSPEHFREAARNSLRGQAYNNLIYPVLMGEIPLEPTDEG